MDGQTIRRQNAVHPKHVDLQRTQWDGKGSSIPRAPAPLLPFLSSYVVTTNARIEKWLTCGGPHYTPHFGTFRFQAVFRKVRRSEANEFQCGAT